MARKKEIPPEVIAVMVRALQAPDDLLSDVDWSEYQLEPEVETDLDDFLAITASLSSKRVKPVRTCTALPPVSGTCSVTIRVPAWVVRAYKTDAAKKGIGYQTYMNRVLRDAVKSFV